MKPVHLLWLGSFISGTARAGEVALPGCAQTSVFAAVAQSQDGDTVRVGPGQCAWSNTLALTHGIFLLGAGADLTRITGTGTGWMVTYSPVHPQANPALRISGFTFDLALGDRSGVNLSSGNTSVPQTRVRIDHNRFQNLRSLDTSTQYLWHAGVRGVVDNNDFGAAFYPIRTPIAATPDGGRSMWNTLVGVELGAQDNNFYFEDNTFALVNSGQGLALSDCQEGGRYAFRYNTITLTGSGQMFDMHGNNGQQYSCMGGEIYGNDIHSSSPGQFLDQRGGRAFVYYNRFSAAGFSVQLREEQADAASPVTYTGPLPPQYPQHVNGSYFWSNLGPGPVSYDVGPQTVGGLPVQGQDFFTDVSQGVGCGPLPSRPASCAAGSAYWATAQSCLVLDGRVGAHPAAPISGVLYQCDANHQWDQGAAPLDYPHPLRAGDSTLAAPLHLRITPGTQPTYQQLVLAAHPVAFWALNPVAGMEPDPSGHGHAGTYQGGTPGVATLPNGEVAAQFNGASQYLTVPSSPAFSIPTTGNLTWEAWIRPNVLQFVHDDGTSGYVDWMGKCEQYAPTCEWEARMYSTLTQETPNRPNRLSAYVFNPGAGLGSAADWQPDPGGIQAGAWYHVVGQATLQSQPAICANAATFPGSIKIWVNGVPWNQAAHGQTGCLSQYNVVPRALGSALNIGTMAGDSFFAGAVGKVAIYDYLLTAQEIARHYTVMTGQQPTGACGATCGW